MFKIKKGDTVDHIPQKKRRRIVYFIETQVMGGAERYLIDLMRGVEKRGDEPVLVCNDFQALVETVRREFKMRILVYPKTFPSITSNRAVQVGLTLNRRWRGFFSLLKIPGLLWMYFNTFRSYCSLCSLFRFLKPDVLHVSAGGYPAAESYRAAVLAGCRVKVPVRVMTVHNRAMPRPHISWVDDRLDRSVIKSLHAITTASNDARQCLMDRRGFPDSVSVIHYGLSPKKGGAPFENLRAELGLITSRRWIGTIGALQPRKGHTVLLDAFALLKGKLSDLGLVIIGDGPCAGSLQKQAHRIGISNDVVFAGFHINARQYISLLDLFVFPSTDYECLPYAVLEAMEARVPVVASGMGGIIEEIENNVTGWLVTPGDSTALARAMEKTLRDPDQAMEFAKKGVARLKSMFSLEEMLERTCNLYDLGDK